MDATKHETLLNLLAFAKSQPDWERYPSLIAWGCALGKYARSLNLNNTSNLRPYEYSDGVRSIDFQEVFGYEDNAWLVHTFPNTWGGIAHRVQFLLDGNDRRNYVTPSEFLGIS